MSHTTPRPVGDTGPVSGSSLARLGLSGSHLGSSHVQSFGQYSEFLRGAVADEESLQMGDNLQTLAAQVESAMALLASQDAAATPAAAQALVQVARTLRGHREMLLALGSDWHRFYEFDAHFVALNQFRVLVMAWAKSAVAPGGKLPAPAEFDVAAWRLLGAGAMLLDVYEQSQLDTKQAANAPLDAIATPGILTAWLARVQRWWHAVSG